MKYQIFTLFNLLFVIINNPVLAIGQTQTDITKACIAQYDSISQITYYNFVDSMPEYPGGQNEMLTFFAKNYNYPNEIDACCKIIVEFIIDSTGKMAYLRIIRGLQEDFDNEALRVLKIMPKWKPGKCNGIPVAVKMTFPLIIELE